MNQHVTITGFQINRMADAAVSDRNTLHASLWVEGAAETMRFRLREGETLLWDSGPRPWQPEDELEDLPLAPCRHYEVTAEVSDGETTARKSLGLDTGLMGEKWRAKWIEPEQETAVREREIQFFEQFIPAPDHFGGHDRLRPAQELRRVFTIEEMPGRAVLCASAHGVYSLWLNGERVDGRRLAPETTPYESLLYYQVYDLTALLRRGENTLRVLLADGWWIGRIGLSGDSCQYGDRLAFLGQMELNYGERTDYVLTDSRYESRPSFICWSDLMMGEKWDLSAPQALWTPCREAGEADKTLALQPMAPIALQARLEPERVFTTPNGELVADFGRCMAGVVSLAVSCPAGRVITLDHSETLDPEGNFFRNILGRNKDQQDVLVCGGGETVFCPEFTYHGFRYVRIDGAAREEIRSLFACTIGTPLETRGSFRCSDERLNRLQENIRRSVESNMVSVPTDCPQREKQGWTGDIQVFLASGTGCFNYDLQGILRAWLAQMRLSQTGDGAIPIVIPSYPAQTAMQERTFGGNTSAGWSDACVLVPLALYESSGDRQILRDNLEMMERWLSFIRKASHDFLWTDGYHFGDWLIPSYENDIQGGSAATAPVIAGCQYAVTVAAYLKVLEALDEPQEKIGECRARLENIRRAVREKFIREDGTIEGDLQGLYVMALYSGVVEGELAKKVAARLDARIEANGGGLDTGFVSTPHLLDALTDHGYAGRAWKLLFRTESPSWLYQVEKGATTIWENWNAIRPDGTVTTSSFNHYALGSVGGWIYRHIGGLRRVGAGWREVEYAPDLDCGLQWAECSYRTAYGLVSCRWKRTGDWADVEVAVPCGVRARLSLPGEERELSAGVHSVRVCVKGR